MNTIDFRNDLLPLKDKIFRMALRITLNAQEAEDLTQDTLVRVWNKRCELIGVNNLEAYCIAICRNMALDAVAKKNTPTFQSKRNMPTPVIRHVRPKNSWNTTTACNVFTRSSTHSPNGFVRLCSCATSRE